MSIDNITLDDKTIAQFLEWLKDPAMVRTNEVYRWCPTCGSPDGSHVPSCKWAVFEREYGDTKPEGTK